MDYKNVDVKNIFATHVFDDRVMKERLPKNIYSSLKKTILLGKPLEPEVANVVANAMKNWAVEKGATHYTHWFQPLNGVTAEKHDAFLMPTADGGVIDELSGKKLVKGESDASSFPSGGVRATFEARGYTVWDCTSPAFLKEDKAGLTLCIPTAFYSYTGIALDKKTPLLRSMEAVSSQALRVLRVLGNTSSKKVLTCVGAEQEYFLIDKACYAKRKDLIFTGRTLFGSMPPKGQEMEDHYYGALKERVALFMKELDVELWKVGVTAKTKHNEVAPAQHELAPIYATNNIAADHNQLIMETLKKVASHYDFVALLHEKPFQGINGSGKHNNWSLETDDGICLFDPGDTPQHNAQFLVFLSAVIKAVDEYADLVRASAANAGNDYRLGGHEAPPSIISIYLGEELAEILRRIEEKDPEDSKAGNFGVIEIGVSTLPKIPVDSTDRNRTSPFAFTGNKFEFRMVGSSASISGPNIILNTIVAEALSQIADRLEKAENVQKEVNRVVRDIVKNHKRILFDGNGYSGDWVKEAENRGLPNISNTVDALRAYKVEKNIRVLERFGVMSRIESDARYEIYTDIYIKQINIEALTMIEIARREILPAVMRFVKEIAASFNEMKNTGLHLNTEEQEKLLKKSNNLLNLFSSQIETLEKEAEAARTVISGTYETACAYRDKVVTAMNALRETGDELEKIVSKNIWPLPTYSDMLFYID